MKYYIQFLVKNLKSEIVDALGSDGVFILDGRNSLNTMINDGYERKNQLKNTFSSMVGFTIKKGDLKRSRTVYKVIF